MQPRNETWPVLSGHLPPPADPFIPRQETVPDFAAGLPAGEIIALVPDPGPAAAGLPGPGGTGKTTLAAALARTHHENGLVDLVVWVAATGRDAVVSAYAQALRDAGLPAAGEDAEQAASVFLDWLSRSGRSWLVVLDGLAEEAAQEDLWPRGPGGRVLVTADRPETAGRIPGAHLVPVGTFSPREALAYVFAKLEADPDQRNGALDLATSIGCAPVALGQAAAVMTETGMDCRRYLAHLTGRQQHRGATGGGPAAMAAEAWSLSADFADHLPPAGHAGRALALLAMLAPGGVPGAVITSEAACAYLLGHPGGSPDAAAQARAAVQTLARAGLVMIDPGSAARTVLIHPSVQAFAQRQLAEAERTQVARAAADALAQAWAGPELPAGVTQALRDCTVAVREAGGAALWAPGCHRALLQAGQSLSSSMPLAAAGYWHRMLGISQQVLGPGHPQTMEISDQFAAACEAGGRLSEAVAVYEQSLADLEASLGPDDRGVLAARLRLSRAYRRQGRPAEAVHLAAQAAADSDRLLGPGHPDSLTAYADLVRACLDAGQLKEAVAAAQHLLEAREQAVGPGHPDALAARDLLADTYQASRRFKDAIALYRRSLAAWERLQGPGHPDTLATRARLALAYRSAGKIKDAISHYERTLAEREQVQGPDHPDTIRARTELALAYYTARRFPVSISQYERALADCERVFGAGHPFTRETRENLNDAAEGARSILGIDLRSPG
ncbi:MAG: tetratricopeptide repeat protein [Gemmatimonadota bacterium]